MRIKKKKKKNNRMMKILRSGKAIKFQVLIEEKKKK
jgi:hypothetical protein